MLGSSFIYISPTDRALHTPPSRSSFNLPRPPPTETALRRGRRVRGEGKEEERKAGRGSNFVGMVTNLVSTDLNNTVREGFPYVAPLADPPDHFVHCVRVKYYCLHGDGGFSLPPPGWIASKPQDVQIEKMKICGSSFSIRLVRLPHFGFPVDGGACSGCHRGYEYRSHDQGPRLGENSSTRSPRPFVRTAELVPGDGRRKFCNFSTPLITVVVSLR